MQTKDFLGHVQNRARLASEGEALRITRATLETLGERLHGGEAKDLASQLPQEIGAYLTDADKEQKYDYVEFIKKVSEREGTGTGGAKAVFHAQAVISVVKDAVSTGEIDDVREQLPDEFDRMFEM